MIRSIKWKALALCFVFILSTLSFPMAGAPVLAVGSAPDSGTGTIEDPYLIDEPAELEWISENYTAVRAKHFRQTADIDMAGIAFDPIGNGSATAIGDPFNGTYDGQRFKISNLAINTNQFCAALFEYAADNCVIENVILENASITNNSTANYMMAAGIVANTGSAVIRNCSVSGTISAAGASFSPYAAGIAGQNYGDIFDCASTAAISNATANGNMGGIAAYVCYANAEVQRNYFAGSLSGAATTKGGIVGNNWQGTYAGNVYLSTAATWAIGGDSNNAGAISASDAAMKQRATFEGQGWNFTNIWKISEGSGYPKHITAPAKPTGVTAVESDGQLAITWNAAARASGYNLYVGTSAGTYGAPVAVSGTSKTLTGLANGTTLYIAVKALHNTEEGPASDEITATPHLSILDLAATAGSGKVDFTFSAATGADTVELMQSTGGEFTTVAGLSLTAASTTATVTGLTNAAQYSFKLKMVYGSNTYYSNTVTVTVGNTVNTLSALTVSGTTLSPSFAPATLSYTASVGSAVSSVDVTATVQSGLSTLKIGGAAQASGAAKNIALDYGSNAVSIAVTAQNGDTLTYTLTVTRALPAGMATQEANLGYDTYGSGTILYAGWYGGAQENAALKFDLSSHSGTLTSATLYFYVSRADSMGANGAFNLFGSNHDGWDSSSGPASWDATPIQSGITGMPEGWYSIPVTNYVKNHFTNVDKTITFYFAGITAADDQDIAFFSPTNATNKPYLALMFQSDDAKLSQITVGGSPLAGFSPTTYTYNYAAPHGTNLSTLAFASAVNSSTSTQGSWTYNATERKWTVTVTAEAGNTQTYTVNVSEAPSTDATLSQITVGGVPLAGFASGTLSYTLDVPHGTDPSAMVLASTVHDHMATQGSWSYNAGTKKWSVTVTAEDGTTTKTYTVTINVLPDNNATLSAITVGGAPLAGFASGTLSYTLDVVHGTNIAALVFASTLSDPNASQGSWSYNAAQKKWSVTVTAEDGTTTKTYSVTVNELPDNDASLSSITVGGSPLAGFASGTLNYTLDVTHGTDIAALVLAGTATDPNASLGSWSYNAAQKKWAVTVTAEDGTTTKVYTVTVNELPGTDATLSAITVGGSALPGFDPATLYYMLDVPHGTDIAALVFASTVHDHMATQTAWNYTSGTRTWSVSVTAEDGTTTKGYAVTVNELPSADATLKSITVGGSALAGFSPATLSYTLDVAHGTDITALVFASEANDHMATQSAWIYYAGIKSWSVTVTAENGTTTKTYTVAVNELPSTDAALKSISVGGSTLPGFDPATLAYTHEAARGTDFSALALTSETHDHMATQSAWAYNATTKTWSVTVTAEDGTTTLTYTVHITQPANNDATLSAIKVGGTDLAGFTPATRDYVVTLPYGTNPAALALSATATDPAASVGTWAYDSGTKKWSVAVTAEDGTTTLTYTVTVTVLPSTDATLSVIRVNGTAIPGFAPGTLNYTVNVANGTNPASLTLTSQAANPTATQSAWAYSAAGQKWSVTVTAGDGVTKKTYAVAIIVLPSANATLSAIWMDGEELAGFNPLVTSYTLTVPYGTDLSAISFTAETTDPDATMGDWAFDSEAGKWSVKVTAENGTSTRTYGITVLLGPAPTATATLEPTVAPTPTPAATQTAVATATASPTATAAPTTAPTTEPTLAPVDAINVTISVTDGQSQLAGAIVTLEGIPHAADGTGLVRADLSPGTYSYTAEAEGCITASGTITVSKDKTVFCIILAKQGMVVLHSGDETKPADPADATQGGTVLIADPAALPQQSTVRLVVEEVKTVTKDAEAVKQAEGSDMEIVQLFDIYLLMDKQKIQPNAPVRVGVPVPESLMGRKLAIVRINDDGTVTRFETAESGGMLFFTVDHFSKYAIIAAEQPKAVLPLWLIIGMGGLVILLVVLLVVLAKQKKKKTREN